VYHENLAFGLPDVRDDVVIRTSGWVGLDQSLDLEMEVPLPVDLLRQGPVLSALSKQTLTLKVGGTLQAPKLVPHPDPAKRAVPQVLLGTLEELLKQPPSASADPNNPNSPADPTTAGQGQTGAQTALEIINKLLENRPADDDAPRQRMLRENPLRRPREASDPPRRPLGRLLQRLREAPPDAPPESPPPPPDPADNGR
jgi:hypothetical protein